jgi:hypothetical protein
MSEQPEGRTKDTKNTAKDKIEQPAPIDKQDPTEPVGVESGLFNVGWLADSAR